MASYYDGTFTTASQTGPRRPSYPFANQAIPSVYPVAYDRNMVVLPASYSPQMATRSTPTNYLTYSEQFDNAAWTKSATTISANADSNPDTGALTADRIFETAVTSTHYISQAYTATAVSHVYSVFVKDNGRSWVLLEYDDSAAAAHLCYFNISAGTVGTEALATGSILSCGNGWYRCSIAFTPSAGAGTAYVFVAFDGSTPSYAGDITLGIRAWGAQMTLSSSASVAYIPTTSASRTGSAPNIELNETAEGSDPFAFLVNESAPEIDFALGRFTRRYARVPGDQIIPSNQWVNRPVMHNIKSGSSYAVSFEDDQRYSWRFDSRKSITRVSSINSVAGTSAMPSSNITFVEGGRTLNLPANSSAATVVSQFNSVLTGLTQVSANVSQGFMSVVWTGTMTSITPPSGVIITQLSSWIATFQSVGTQTTPSTTTFETSAAHGAIVGDRVALWAGETLAGTGEVIAVGTTTSFGVMTNNLISANTLVTHCAFSSDADACYVNGPKLCTVKRTQKFYLPGVTTGITTYADVPDVTVYTDPISWLGRILAVPTGYAAISVSELESWEGPILTQETSEVQMTDAIDTVTP